MTAKKSDDQYTNVLLEEINGKFDLVLEMFGYLRDNMATKQDISRLESKQEDMQSDITVIKAAITDLSIHVDDHENRITALEHTAL